MDKLTFFLLGVFIATAIALVAVMTYPASTGDTPQEAIDNAVSTIL